MDASSALILQGDALHLPLPDASVDLVVTSPPYWALRSYSAGEAEIGSEPTPAEYLEALWAATAEMMRVLKPTGSIFVDLGDKYSSAAGPQNGQKSAQLRAGSPGKPAGPKWATTPRGQAVEGVREKSLLLLPERYRVGCVDRLGLIARAVLVWNKPNGLPESVTDRVRRSHEDWVHLTKQPRYYSATDEVREPYEVGNGGRQRAALRGTFDYADDARRYSASKAAQEASADGWQDGFYRSGYNPLGKLPGSVWSVPSEPLRLPAHLGVQHYAAFPSEWPRRLILGWSPPGGVVLDPFAGTGTTVMVARKLGRAGVGVDLSHGYCRAARWRVRYGGAKAEARTNGERQGSLL